MMRKVRKELLGELWGVEKPDPCEGYEEGPSADRTLLSEPLISSTGWWTGSVGKTTTRDDRGGFKRRLPGI